MLLKTRLKEFRAKHDMNQQTLAKLVGVRRETIGHLERGTYSPSLKLAWDIAKVFNVSIEEIFRYEEE
ncbi:helix-turn-helix transcriptional regulator [Bacillus nitroreducens]